MTPVLPIAEILGIDASVRSLLDLDRAVSSGLPKRSLVRLASRIYRDRSSAAVFRDALVPPTTWRRWNKKLSRQASERVERMARVVASAEHAFDDRDQARVWIGLPHRELGGKTPLETAQTEIGARRVEAVLLQLFFGLPA